MGRACRVCQNPERDAIETALVSGEGYRAIARHFALSKDSVARHREHLSPALTAVPAAREEARSEALLDQLQALIARGQRIADRAEQGGRDVTALAAIRELRGLLELLGKVTGEIRSTPAVVVNLVSTDEWVSVRSRLLAALAPWPDARISIAAVLAESETE